MQRSFVYDHYYRYQEITDILKGYAEKYPALTRLSSIGQTPQGRSIWLLEVTDTAAGAFEDKPAYYMEANIHAGEVTGSMWSCIFWIRPVQQPVRSGHPAAAGALHHLCGAPRPPPTAPNIT